MVLRRSWRWHEAHCRLLRHLRPADGLYQHHDYEPQEQSAGRQQPLCRHAGGTVPAVAFVRPLEQMAGHPANATLSLYENFATNLVNLVHDRPDLWNKTAILITVDEGGGYYDSGYIQTVDFFGDGTRIPMIAVSPLRQERLRRSHLLRPCLGPEVYLAQLGSEPALEPQP